MTAGAVEAERNTALLRWYEAEARSFPWRATSDPYAILVSETMLQQTRADRVEPFYRGFMEHFPDVASLAAAPFAEVARAWSGLGYNTRALRLHQAAKVIAGRGWPDTVEQLEDLPGVGAYTARAVAVFAFGRRDVAVDTNLKRVLSRWYGEALSGTGLHRAALDALGDDAVSWNQAMMDLGATICRPRRPGCDRCPVEPWCTGPEVYQPPSAQGRFEGSVRQVRGALVRMLVDGVIDDAELDQTMGHLPTDLVAEALDGLMNDGLVVETEAGYELTD
ncbi:MAG: A/G-specific adenine glycosylase [Acidimicrobiales bacterium]